MKSLNVKFEALLPVIQEIGSIVLQSEVKRQNLWRLSAKGSQNSESRTERGEKFAANFRLHAGAVDMVDETGPNGAIPRYRCMLSGEVGFGQQVVVAHLIPAKSSTDDLESLGFTAIDADSLRNGLSLAKGFEEAFDHRQASFIETIGKKSTLEDQASFIETLLRDPGKRTDEADYSLTTTYTFTIWDSKCRENPLWKGSQLKVGQFEGRSLVLGNVNPMKRALSLHTYHCFLHSKLAKEFHPKEFGSPGTSLSTIQSFRKSLTALKATVEKDMNDELGDYNSDDN
jgi:hypothetical protein